MPFNDAKRPKKNTKFRRTSLAVEIDSAISRLKVAGSTVPLSGNNLGQVVHTHVPLSAKQYNLVPVKGR